MLFYNFKIALRNLKSKLLITIGIIVTLVLGGVCSLLLYSYVSNELAMNQHHKKVDETYLVTIKAKPNSDWVPSEISRFSDFNSADFPEIQGNCSIGKFRKGEFQLTVDNQTISPEGIFADEGLFKIFDFQILAGDRNALTEPGSIFISESLSQKLFGEVNPLGKSIQSAFRQDKLYTVRGILANSPSNSSLHFDFIVPRDEAFRRLSIEFLLFKENTDQTSFIDKIKHIGRCHTQYKESELSIVPLSDIYFNYSNSNFKHYFSKTGNKKSVYILISCLILIFVVSCLNFSNLQLAGINNSGKRNAIQKVNGAQQKHLIAQNLNELLIIAFLSVIGITLFFFILLPHFNKLIGSNLQINAFHIFLLSSVYLLIQVALSLVYPFVVLSKSDIAKPLKNQTGIVSKLFGQRNIVILQFSLLIFLLISTITVSNQLDLLLSKDLGFRSENIIQTKIFNEIPFNENRDEFMAKLDERKQNFKYVCDQLTASSNIISFSQSTSPIQPMSMPWTRADEKESFSSQNMMTVTPSSAHLFDFKIKHGRFFDEEIDQSRDQKIVVNEAALKYWNIKDISETHLINSYWFNYKFEIIGVIEDFNYQHLEHRPAPLILSYFKDLENDFFILLNKEKTQEGIEFVKELFHQFNPSKVFEYSFLANDIQEMYKDEKRLSKIYLIFTLITIIISMIGLFTISLYESRKRTKEIGIRKSNGAKTYEIISLLNQDVLKLLVISFVISTPIAWYTMHKWLQNFAYKTELSWWIFILAGIIAMGVALLTVSWHSWIAARRNPVESLRYE